MAAPDPIHLLSRMVAFPTVSDRPVTELAAFLAERSEAAGFRVERFQTSEHKCNVVATRGPVGTDGLILSGHMDVVPTEGQDWSSDPFVLTERDGRLHARGAADMKGFIAATIAATASLPDLDRELMLVWTHDEEVGCKGSAALAERLEALERPLPSLALIGEPTDFRVARMHPGHITLQVVCTGRAAHSSLPDLGVSAIKVATRALVALEGLEEALRHERAFEDELARPWPILNVGTISGGAAVNIVPESCEIRLGVRPLPGQSVEALVARLRARIDEVDHEVSAWGGHARLELLHGVPALLTERGTELEGLLAPWASHPGTCAVPFATDGGNFSRLGVRSLVFGPGSIAVAHRPDEFVSVADLLRGTEVVRDLVQRRCVN